MSTIRLKNISKAYDLEKLTVKDINLEIDEGEFIVLVGPSGCGKSTTLRMIAGLETITQGELFIDDELVNDVKPQDRDLAMVFQSYALYPHKTVYQNLAYPLKLKKIPKVDIEKKVHDTAKLIEIEDILQRYPRQLSGGQKQRVALGRCIIRSPKAFLMDEPLSNLDAKLRTSMRNEIVRLQKRLNGTFVYVTHDQIEAMTMGSRIVVMNKGEIQQIGTLEEVYSVPNNIFVASFIGSPAMNFLKFKDSHINLNNYTWEIMTDSEITFGIRPERIQTVQSTPNNVQFEAEVLGIETLGSENYVRINVNDEEWLVRDFNRLPFEVGRQYDFYLDKEDFHYFNSKSGERIFM